MEDFITLNELDCICLGWNSTMLERSGRDLL